MPENGTRSGRRRNAWAGLVILAGLVAVLIPPGCATTPAGGLETGPSGHDPGEGRWRLAYSGSVLMRGETGDTSDRGVRMITSGLDGTREIPALREMPEIHGLVTGADPDLNIVLVSVGADDEVRVGFTMTVHRGTRYLGRLRIEKVGPDWASGSMTPAETREFPVRGDQVATRP